MGGVMFNLLVNASYEAAPKGRTHVNTLIVERVVVLGGVIRGIPRENKLELLARFDDFLFLLLQPQVVCLWGQVGK